ncbi:DNA sulfur modification protein DndB [Photobacterium iliopiscarium]|uniref:DNA sulfur modification protein DndB n=1 Tax=Photobacterium iliopiscarium TaxID=56192 RepID=UPI000D1796FF|nr:DNA sulfur modification protein DndB [Photobacterium iliopiscarium]PSU00875.1 DNA sulfur modification protein DndB [Photobacterium iliopiscarium]PSV82082.1 DNA sulfur modification protein DndB [Photobacterium iliopiscarium]
MSNKTLIPALKAKVGDWVYYICIMKYAQVAKEVNFAYELGGNDDLNSLIQRGISERTKEITDYLLRSKHRFLGSLIVAAYGGDPQYMPVRMEDSEDYLRGLDNSFGVLTFDGGQQYFALDGQHRLKAIKDAIKKDPELGAEEISVILVSHYDTELGKEKTRRLFTNINKNAKSTTKSENLALDEDDGFAILTRRLISDHDFFKQDGRVSVFTKQGEFGELSLATSVRDNDKRAVTSIKQLYEMVKELSFGTNLEGISLSKRPTDDDLEDSYLIISERIIQFFDACGNLPIKVEKLDDIRGLRKNKAAPGAEEAFLKGIVQRCVSTSIRNLIDQELITWEDALDKLKSFSWKLGDAPWSSVCVINDGKLKMQTSREFSNLLNELLLVHISPNSKQQIKRTRKLYLDIKNQQYTFAQDDLENGLKDNV